MSVCRPLNPVASVYRGVYDEMVVAVKVTESTTEKAIKSAESESAISLELNHPNLVKVGPPTAPFAPLSFIGMIQPLACVS